LSVVAMRWCLLVALALATPGGAQAQMSGPSALDDLEQVVTELFVAIQALSDYRARGRPPVFQVPQHVLEAKVCDLPCDVRAAYLPSEGIYLAGNLDPVREPLDRSALLHELVHYLQQGHPKFAALAGCARERAKEEEAYALQNAYLASLGRSERVTFFDGEFDCPPQARPTSP
jgi:hypothetical protein